MMVLYVRLSFFYNLKALLINIFNNGLILQTNFQTNYFLVENSFLRISFQVNPTC